MEAMIKSRIVREKMRPRKEMISISKMFKIINELSYRLFFKKSPRLIGLIRPICPIRPISPAIAGRKSSSTFFSLSILSLIIIFPFSFSIAFAQEKNKEPEDYLKKKYKFQEAEGDYLVEGGLVLFSIKKNHFSDKVSHKFSDFLPNTISYFSGYQSINPLTAKEWKKDYSIYSYGNGNKVSVSPAEYKNNIFNIKKLNPSLYFPYRDVKFFSPSEDKPGDWDLIYPNEEYLPRQPLYLHKITKDLENVHEYYRLVSYYDNIYSPRGEKEGAAKLLNIASSLIKKYPDDNYYRIIYYDALIRNNKLNDLEKDLDLHKETFESSGNETLILQYNRCRRIILAAKSSAAGNNAWPDLGEVFSRGMSLTEKITQIDRFRNYKEFIIQPNPPTKPENFVPPQYREYTYTASMEAFHQIMNGNRDKALDIFTGIYSFSELLLTEDYRMGYPDIEIGEMGFEFILNNCCETNDEITSFTNTINALITNSINRPAQKQLPYDYLSLIRSKADDEKRISENLAKISLAKLYTLKCAAIIKKYQIVNKGFPKTNEEIKKILGNALPKDPFSDADIGIVPGENKIAFYSIGSDKKDDKGTILHTRKNKFNTPGDIITTVYEYREYPYPAKGLKVNSKEEIEKKFSKGLIPEEFKEMLNSMMTSQKYNKRKILSVEDKSPVVVYNDGLRTNRPEIFPKDKHKMEPGEQVQEPGMPEIPLVVQYDPTNGVYSEGDIFWELPRRDEHKEPETQRTARVHNNKTTTANNADTHE